MILRSVIKQIYVGNNIFQLFIACTIMILNHINIEVIINK